MKMRLIRFLVIVFSLTALFALSRVPKGFTGSAFDAGVADGARSATSEVPAPEKKPEKKKKGGCSG
jgi:hypothetical protein